MTQVRRVALAARVFTIAALLPIGLLLGAPVRTGAVCVALVALVAQCVSFSRTVRESWVAVLEGAAVALLAIVLAPHNDAVVPYLVIPALIGGLARRLWGMGRVVCAEVIVLSAGVATLDGNLSRQLAGRELVWVVTAVGIGFLGASMHRMLAESVTETTYRSAVDLIKQLHDISGRLTDGLDVAGIAEGLLQESADLLPMRAAALFTRTLEGAVTPLRLAPGSSPEDLEAGIDLIERAWFTRAPARTGRSLAVPLTRESQVIVILVAECEHVPANADIAALDGALSAETLKLYAALLFAEVRNAAMQEERRRLAREVHDGIAQDVASLGYLVDAVPPASAEQEAQLAGLREEITRVVGELRHSVFDLRNDIGAGRGLGENLSAMARHIGARTPMTVHVTLDEATERLGIDVEAQLLRIAQEAMNNARKHSGAENLWLSCRVRAPRAELEVRDDGAGLNGVRPGEPRADSHGLQIMQERAERIGAQLEVSSSGAEQGTRVRVRVGGPTR